MARTDDAERFAAQLAEAPLLAESVYLGPKYHHTGGDKEVTDLLLLHHDRAILIEIKCQDDPASRAEGDLAAWIGKAGKKAVSQLRGSIRTLKERNYWCDHPVFKRVHFKKGQLTPVQGIVLIEHLERGGVFLPRFLPLNERDIPISYFSFGDFLKVISELRTFTEILRYLIERRNLSDLDPYFTGRELDLLGHYMLNDGRFPSGLTYHDRLIDIHNRREEFERFLNQKGTGDEECAEVEKAARSLRKRASGYETRAKSDQNYRLMQSALMELTYGERRLVGRRVKQATSLVSMKPLVELISEKDVYASMPFAVIAGADLAVIVVATRNATVRDGLIELSKFTRVVYETVGKMNILAFNIRESSPKYQFIYTEYNTVDVFSSADVMPSRKLHGWITYRVRTRFFEPEQLDHV